MRIYEQAVIILPDGQFMACQSIATNEQVFGKVLDKNVPSADGQLLNSCSIA